MTRDSTVVTDLFIYEFIPQFEGHTEQLQQLYAKVYDQNECLRKIADKMKASKGSSMDQSKFSLVTCDLVFPKTSDWGNCSLGEEVKILHTNTNSFHWTIFFIFRG